MLTVFGRWSTVCEREVRTYSMRRRKKGAWAAGLLAAGIVVPRAVWFRRTELPRTFRLIDLEGVHDAAATRLCAAHLVRTGSNSDCVVITAHGFLDSMRTPSMVQLASMLGERFDVLSFDFRGHGASGGCSNLSFQSAADDLMRIIEYARVSGYRRVGVVGYSMGAAAAILAAAQGADVDAVASVSCPVCSPAPLRRFEQLSVGPLQAWAWAMGTRVASVLRPGPWPLDEVTSVAPVPLLVVHCQFDYLVLRCHSEELYRRARPPKGYLYVPGAVHARPTPSAEYVRDWLTHMLLDGAQSPGALS